MALKAGKLLCCAGDPTQYAVLVVAKYLDVEVDIEKVVLSTGSLNFIDKDGKEIKSICAVIDALASAGKKTYFYPSKQPAKGSIAKQISTYYNFYVDFAKKTSISYIDPKEITVKDPAANAEGIMNGFYAILKSLNSFLEDHTYLVSETISAADVFAFFSVYYIYKYVLGESKKVTIFPYLSRWFDLVLHQNNVHEVVGSSFKQCINSQWKEFEAYCENKVMKSKQTAVTSAPLKFSLHDWKTIYNTKDASESIKWFWENFYPEEFSVYKVIYAYPEDLPNPLVAKNLIIGFCQRIEAASKDSFGVLSVLGKDGDVQVKGYMMFAGEGVHKAVLEAPDYDSYTFTLVDPTKPNVKAEMNDYLEWKDTIEGLPFCDAKTFQ